MSRKFHPLRVVKIVHETHDAVSIHFEKPQGEEFTYLPGQYLTLKIRIGDEDLRRAFSLSSSPVTDPHLAVTVKAIPGGKTSGFLKEELKEGAVLEVYPPMGNFICVPDSQLSRHLILIGAGSGITPLFSIIKTILIQEPQSKITLIFGNRDEESIIFYLALKEFEKAHPERFRVIHTLTKAGSDWTGLRGRLDRNSLMPVLQSILSSDKLPKSFYLCGPGGMMDEAKHALAFLGVNKKDIHQELFSAPVPSETEGERHSAMVAPDLKRETFQVTVILDGKENVITVKPDQAILDVAIQEGLDPPFACQLGICTTCRAKVHSGAIEMDETEGLTDEEIEDGYILTCQAHPLSPDCVVEYG